MKYIPYLNFKSFYFEITCTIFVLIALLINPVLAQKAENQTPKNQINHSDLSDSLDKNIQTEKEDIKQLNETLKNVQRLGKSMDVEMNAYMIQIPAYNTLLHAATTEIDDLQKAWLNNRDALEAITATLKELNQKRNVIDQLQIQTNEQYTLNQKKLSEIKSKSSIIESSLKKLQILTQILSNKQELLDKIKKIHTEQISKLNIIQQDFIVFAEKFDNRIKERKKQELFQRKAGQLTLLSWAQIELELKQLTEQARLLISSNFWVEQFQTFWKSNGFLFFSFTLLFGVIQILLFRFRIFFNRLEQKPFYRQQAWRYLTLQVFQNSLPLLGTTLFVYIYSRVQLFYPSVPFIRVIVYVFLIQLFTQWILDFLKLLNQKKTPAISDHLISRLRILIISIRYYAFAYVIFEGALGNSSVILLLGRILAEISFFIWCLLSLKVFRKTLEQSFRSKPKLNLTLKPLMISLVDLVAGGGLFLELIGYGQLALYWYVSWGRSILVFLWGTLIILVLQEWDQDIRQSLLLEKKGSVKPVYPFRWLFIRVSWLAATGLIIMCLFFAWGTKQTAIITFLSALNHQISIGEMRFSLLGFLYAFLILLVTHAATRLWRRVFKKKILSDSGLEIGLQESVTTITAYILWSLGILGALYAFGINPTSLAVLFGALGIGLGFGLQNIFNNFVSGLILLFERPIQVGDVVEVNGIWGKVNKINVRSTLVQTYDNASLIIPNSEFISNQLTNWSFKDSRIRRKITVGVAYGSDLNLVRQTLMEVAENHPKVLAEPQPDILFEDFGDSALVFKLRIWTLIDYALSTDTEIRFEIDRLFRKRNIQIPFPQQDIHFQSTLVHKNLDQAEKEINSSQSSSLPVTGGENAAQSTDQ